jgi:uncharacterized protein YyaL (SSP411 family)
MAVPNRLIHEKSPYLLQHAYNPVDWYPWGDEAFEKARKEDKPIFLSIGYSTCYWCHVMEREVFEIPEIAKVMNELFVNIKVDREEHPDVDRVYMTALQSMTGSGGWPMSMFLTPDLKPFYGATYIPPDSKYGMPGFEQLITEIHNAWKTRRGEVERSGAGIIDHIAKYTAGKSERTTLNEELFNKAIEQFKNSFDEEYGGFGGAPKFPRPVAFNFLMRAYRRFSPLGSTARPGEGEIKRGAEESLRMVVRTLFQMARGGMYDHLGGGFHRYSVDRFWIVPHFEKMLYDQAQLASVYIDAYLLTKEKFFAEIAEDILNYVERRLTHPEGGFYSAEDAESLPALKLREAGLPDNASSKEALSSEAFAKEEGAFYVWEKSEIEKLLGKNSEIFCYYFGVGERGNTPAGSDPHNVFINKNILYNAHSISETANKFELSTDEANRIIVESEELLFEARGNRPNPHLDDKILTSWNGMMISAFAKTYAVFEKQSAAGGYLELAQRSADFILEKLYDENKRMLLHRFRDGEARFEGTLEDYAFFIQGLLDLYESCFDEKYLEKAAMLSELMITYFYDNDEAGFFDTSGNDKSILVKTKEDYDSAEPTGNSIAIMNLLRISQLTDNKDMLDKAQKSLELFSGKMTAQPYAMPQMLCALDFSLAKPTEIIIAGKKDDALTQEMIHEVHSRFIPNRILILAEPGKENKLIPFLSSIVKQNDKTTAYVCENFACKLPVSDLNEFRKLIE